ncbi:hypothetical protein V1514DRAFT_320160 [Lipomyces japonicus]|uniref:uncharacterized protein n=1 Tax=Lipomyces japonicus TaxID=56871 RepID=UPI0034CD773C
MVLSDTVKKDTDLGTESSDNDDLLSNLQQLAETLEKAFPLACKKSTPSSLLQLTIMHDIVKATDEEFDDERYLLKYTECKLELHELYYHAFITNPELSGSIDGRFPIFKKKLVLSNSRTFYPKICRSSERQRRWNRYRFPLDVEKLLKFVYETCKKPSILELESLAIICDLKFRQVSVWVRLLS